MKVYVLQCGESSGTVLFKAYNPYVKEVEWTGIKERAAFWLHAECADSQASSLEMKHHGTWIVKEVEI